MIYRVIDLETYSELDLKKYGLMNYINHPSFEINLLCYADIDITKPVDFKTMKVIQLENEELENYLDNQIHQDMSNPNITWIAHNANFEMHAMGQYTTVSNINWICTMVWAYTVGLGGSLSSLSKILKLEHAKMDEGTALINYFAKPCRATKANGGRTRNYPENDLQKWDLYKEYNRYDVLATIELWYKVLRHFPMLDQELKYWRMDLDMQKNGIRIDMSLVNSAITYKNQNNEKNLATLKELTKLDNPKSTQQFREWLQSRLPTVDVVSVDKEHLKLYYPLCDDYVKNVIDYKRAASKSSLKKYDTLAAIQHEGRLYNYLQFCGAGRTGRFAGRGFQVHNLPRNKLGNDFDLVRTAYKNGTRPITEILPFELSQLLRSCLIPDENKIFMVADYSAIEARVAAWVAGEKWVLDAFRDNRDIYKENAAQMLHKKYEDITKEDRNIGKVAVLACGYGGGEKAVERFAPDMDAFTRQEVVDLYRAANKKIQKMWKTLEQMFRYTLETKKTTTIKQYGIQLLKMSYKKGCMVLTLPSGRNIVYVRAKISPSGQHLSYEGKINQAWGTIDTHGGKLFENAVQAISRDLLLFALQNCLDYYGSDVKFHVHDEIIVQAVNPDEKDLKFFCDLMVKKPDWAIDLPMKADGYLTEYYMKEEE